jgi:hypothetical protein
MKHPGDAGLTAQRLGDASPFIPQDKGQPNDATYNAVPLGGQNEM